MRVNAQFLLVASVVEGRNFPSRPHHKIVVEAKFGGEILITDDVEHDVNPEFHQELAWELDKKALHEHRIQRSVIKVQVFAIDTRTSVRELIGYNVIDLHYAHSSKPTIKWYAMLHCRYPKSKPELKIGLYLEDQPDLASCAGGGVSCSPTVFKDLKPIWHTDNGDYYQLGPADKCATNFCVSVTVASANHLTNLLSSDHVANFLEPGRKFFFLYTLFGTNISTDQFGNLQESFFLPERTSVRVRSSLDAIRQYFTRQSPFQVSLYSLDVPVPLGTCQLCLTDILPSTVQELESRPVVIDRFYRLVPPKDVQTKLAQLPNDLQPVVGLTLSFKLESPVGSSNISASPTNRKATPQAEDRHPNNDLNNSCHSATPKPAVPVSSVATRKQTNLSHFELAIELGSVTLAEGAQPLSGVTLCCSCGLFLTAEGQPTSLTTQPPVELLTSGVPVPLAFSRFVVEFASRADRISSVLNKHEVKLQLWTQSKNSPTPVLAAVGSLSLTRLAESNSIVVLGREGKTVEQQSITESVPLILAGELATGGQVTANATASVVLRNLGATTDSDPDSPKPGKSSRSAKNKAAGPLRNGKGRLGHGHSHGHHRKSKGGVDSGKVQAAIELELWKDAQEKLFEKQLKSREIEHMKEMAEEWQRRDQQRQQLLTKKMEEYARLDTELRARLGELEHREVDLRAGERELEHLRSELARYKEMRSVDLREAAKRMEEEAQHRISLERSRAIQIEEELQKTKILLNESEEKYRRLERDFAGLKQQQRLAANPDAELVHKLNVVTLDKEELERRVDSLQKAKLHYKQQWGHALRELSALRQEQTEQSRLLVEKQQRDLEQMRLRYLADEEKKLLNNDFEELKRFREEVSRLGVPSSGGNAAIREGPSRTSESPSASLGVSQKPPIADLQKPHQRAPVETSKGSSLMTDPDYITRLIEERDTLLRTGVYSPDDRIIVNLEKKINASLTARSEGNTRPTLQSDIVVHGY